MVSGLRMLGRLIAATVRGGRMFRAIRLDMLPMLAFGGTVVCMVRGVGEDHIWAAGQQGLT